MSGDRTAAFARRTAAALLASAAAVVLLASCAAVGGAGDDPTAGTTAAAVETPSGTPAPTETLVVQTPTLSPTASATASLGAVTPVASAVWNGKAQELDVSGIVTGAIETGGTCTATATKGEAVVTASGPAAPAASYTGCQALVLKGAALVPGEWQVRVEYRSDQSQGVSASVPVTVG